MEPTSNGKRKRPWRRIVAGTVAALLVVIAICLLISASVARRQADTAMAAEPIRLKVDWSTPGEYEGEFVHTFDGGHRPSLVLETEPPFASWEEMEASVQGLRGHVAIVGRDGTPVWQSELVARTIDLGGLNQQEGLFPAVVMDYFPVGTYRLKLTIEQGAPSLAGTPQHLVARYYLCGMCMAGPVAIPRLTAIACFVIAGGIGLGIFIVSRRRRA